MVVRAALPVLVAIATAAAGEVLERSGGSFEFRPGVIVDRERATVFVMNPARGIDAVDLVSGKLLGRTAQAAKPLLRYRDRLVAQAEPSIGEHVLRIALLDSANVAARARFVEIPLPAGVQAAIDEAMESSFSAGARVRDGTVVLSWQYDERRATGPPPGPGGRAADRKAAGSVRIDVQTGEIGPIDDPVDRPEPELPAALARLSEAKALGGPVWRVGNAWVVIERVTQAGNQRVSLERWDAETGEALPDVTLFDGGLGFRSVSADRRHLLASRRDPSDGRLWQWAVFSLETGAKVAVLREDSPGARFFLAGCCLVHETNASEREVAGQRVIEPGGLRAVDLETGVERWTHPIRDTKYRGPNPPRIGR